MGITNFIETFFYISLGITFILILLLVYHFKQRIISLEQKSETVVEIVNTIVKELNAIKYQQTSNNIQYYVQENTEPIVQSLGKSEVHLEEEEEESESESDDDDEDDEESESDQDDDESDDDENVMIEPNEYDEPDIDSIDQIKVVTLNNETEILSEDINSNLDTYEVLDEPVEETLSDLQEVQPEEMIHVEKIVQSDLENSDTTAQMTNNQKEIYQKMSVSALKALVISKGLCSDASRLKKNELIKMLEEIV